ncbi:MAG: nucleotidyltransferase family protein [Chloroflexi bacterium]|nr:nucleotidyltransferase family protein [Chloroflexota bacterium]
MLPVAILAGGLATRLQPLTNAIPKSLADVNGEPFVSHQLRLLRRNGFDRVVICAGFLGEMIREFVGDGRGWGLEIEFSFDGPKLRGTAGALKEALPLLGESFFVLYGDSYLPCDYASVRVAFEASGKPALMTVFRNEGRWDTSNVEFADGQIRACDKLNRTPGMHHIDYGLGAFHRSALDTVPWDRPYDLAALYQRLLAQGHLAAYEVGQRFYEIGWMEGLEETRRYLRENESARGTS